jgi:hypothetical protein
MRITVQRDRKTVDGMFGDMVLDWNPFTAYVVENLALMIPAGTYPVTFYKSPHFQRVMPHLIVPGRTEIMIHWANWPGQLKGCLALGNAEEPDAVDNSIATWNQFYNLLNMQEGITCQILDIPVAVA